MLTTHLLHRLINPLMMCPVVAIAGHVSMPDHLEAQGARHVTVTARADKLIAWSAAGGGLEAHRLRANFDPALRLFCWVRRWRNVPLGVEERIERIICSLYDPRAYQSGRAWGSRDSRALDEHCVGRQQNGLATSWDHYVAAAIRMNVRSALRPIPAAFTTWVGCRTNRWFPWVVGSTR